MFLIYDERYNIDEDSAVVLATADTAEEAKEYAEDWPGSVVVEVSNDK